MPFQLTVSPGEYASLVSLEAAGQGRVYAFCAINSGKGVQVTDTAFPPFPGAVVALEGIEGLLPSFHPLTDISTDSRLTSGNAVLVLVTRPNRVELNNTLLCP